METLPSPQFDRNFIVADADYFETKARLCYRLANRAADDTAKVTLVTLGFEFESKAWRLREDQNRPKGGARS